MKLVHYTDKPIAQVYATQHQDDEWLKPSGFWVSDDDAEDSWPKWCIVEDYNTHRLEIAYEVTLSKEADVLVLTTVEDIKNFTEDYRQPGSSQHVVWYLNWSRVAEEWDGMVITPYQWSLRLDLDHLWYNGWDCASGCIWSVAAIEKLTRVK